MTEHSRRARRQSTGLGVPVRVKSRFASDVAREIPTGRCSVLDADTSNRPRSRSGRRPCPRQNAPRRRGAGTGPGPTEPSATPCHILASGGPVTEYGPDRNATAIRTLTTCWFDSSGFSRPCSCGDVWVVVGKGAHDRSLSGRRLRCTVRGHRTRLLRGDEQRCWMACS
jgi:hypothetical protein